MSDLVTVAVSPPALPENFSIPQAAALARDLSISMYDREVILRKHRVTDAQCKVLENNPYFIKLLEQAAAEWNSPRSIQQRLALEAAVALEGVLPDVVARMSAKTEPLSGVVEAGKLLTKVAGIGEKSAPGPAGEKFTITIDLSGGGGEKQTFEKTLPPVIEAFPVQPFAEGAAALLDLYTEPEKPGTSDPISKDPEGTRNPPSV